MLATCDRRMRSCRLPAARLLPLLPAPRAHVVIYCRKEFFDAVGVNYTAPAESAGSPAPIESPDSPAPVAVVEAADPAAAAAAPSPAVEGLPAAAPLPAADSIISSDAVAPPPKAADA